MKPNIIAAVLILSLAVPSSGCYAKRRASLAGSAASIWEAADAIDRGALNVGACTAAIKAQARAILIASGHTYAPAGVVEGGNQ